MLLAAPVVLPALQLPTAEPTAVTVELINGTTGEPGAAERITLQELTAQRQVLASAEGVDGTATLPTAPVHRLRDYLVIAYRSGVHYYAKASGYDLQRRAIKVYVFDATDSLAGLAIEGLNLVIRRQGALFDLEYLITVTNETRPQATVRPSPHTVELVLPSAATNVRAELTRGPEPEELEIASSGGRHRLPAPLPPGRSQLRLTADLPFASEIEFPLTSNLPVRSWSLLTLPPTLDVRGVGLEPVADTGTGDFARIVGPALDAGQEYRFVLAVRAAAEAATEIFTETAPAEAATGAAAEEEAAREDNVPIAAIVVPLAVLVLVLYLWHRRRRTA
jgi:hypothetical protein